MGVGFQGLGFPGLGCPLSTWRFMGNYKWTYQSQPYYPRTSKYKTPEDQPTDCLKKAQKPLQNRSCENPKQALLKPISSTPKSLCRVVSGLGWFRVCGGLGFRLSGFKLLGDEGHDLCAWTQAAIACPRLRVH